MIKSFCKAEDYQQINQIKDNVYIVKFSPKQVDNNIIYTAEKVIGEITPEKLIDIRLKELEKYDTSPAVNKFFYGGKSMWFDKVTRTCINYSIEVKKKQGDTETVLFDNEGNSYTLPIDLALALFAQLEIYATQCYNQTATHKSNLKSLTNIEDILNYDITTGYPEKLNL